MTKTPHSPEAEMAVLGSIFFNPEVITDVAAVIESGHFYVTANRIVAEAIWDLWGRNEPIDIAIVYDVLKKRNRDQLMGGHERLMRLADSVPEDTHAVHYAKIVRDKAVRRQFIEISRENALEAMNEDNPILEVLDQAQTAISNLVNDDKAGRVVRLADALRELVHIIDERPQGRLVTGVSTGLYDLDELISGFQPGQLIILAARPSVGKTTLALNIAEHIALQEKKPVGFFSLEMSVSQLAQNILCSHARIDAHKFRSGYLTTQEYTKMGLSIGYLSEAEILFDDSSAVTPTQIKARARQMQRQYAIEFVIVDYLQLMKTRAENRQQEITEISRQLKLLAKDMNVPILVVSQLSRALETAGDKRPKLHHLRESGAIEQDADVVLMLYRADYYKAADQERDNLAELNVAKQRNGPTGLVKLRFSPEILRFESLAKHDEPVDRSDY